MFVATEFAGGGIGGAAAGAGGFGAGGRLDEALDGGLAEAIDVGVGIGGAGAGAGTADAIGGIERVFVGAVGTGFAG